MPKFPYKAKNPTAKPGQPIHIQDAIEADNEKDARKRLGDRGYTDIQFLVNFETVKPGRVVQHHYTNARLKEISRQGGTLRDQTVALFREEFAHKLDGRGYGGDQKNKWCAEAYDRLINYLQQRDLTINFEAQNWFLTPNNYESYVQMYEKAGKDASGRMVLDGASDPKNPPPVRVAADDFVTFPQHWNTPKPGIPLPRGTMKGGGLQVGQQSPQRIMGHMMAGKHLLDQKAVEKEGAYGVDGFQAKMPQDNLTALPEGKYLSPNARFNPKTKQIFAALNYGQRPNGSSTYYGKSHFVLAPSLKINAIYFPCDTFIISSGAESQVSYETLGAIYLKASEERSYLREQLRKTFFENLKLEDSMLPTHLMEAHIFEPVNFKHISELHLRLTKDIDAYAKGDIIMNAQNFCEKWKIKTFDWQ